MNNNSVSTTKKKIIFDIKAASRKMKHSPNRREIPHLATRCYNYFGSFNKAKLKAGLSIKNVRITKFPKNAFKIDKDLASIVSYLTFDGHLYKNFKGMLYSSKNTNDLREFEKIMKRKFGLKGNYHLNNSGSSNQTHVIYFFNKKTCEFLFKKGLPKGDKAIQPFDVPPWIKRSKEFSREYLKIAFLCEGSMEKEKRRKSRISFTQSKEVSLLDSGLTFMDTIKSMLKKFNINAGKSYISKGSRIRKRDNKTSKDIRFRVAVNDNNKFIREIGWVK